MFFPGLIASFTAIITEKKGRRGTLALYMTNLVGDTNPCIPKHNVFKHTVDDIDENRFDHCVSCCSRFELKMNVELLSGYFN